MAETSYTLIPINGKRPEHFDQLREVVDHLREQAYENFYIQIQTDFDHDKVVDQIQEQIWYVLSLKNVDDIY